MHDQNRNEHATKRFGWTLAVLNITLGVFLLASILGAIGFISQIREEFMALATRVNGSGAATMVESAITMVGSELSTLFWAVLIAGIAVLLGMIYVHLRVAGLSQSIVRENTDLKKDNRELRRQSTQPARNENDIPPPNAALETQPGALAAEKETLDAAHREAQNTIAQLEEAYAARIAKCRYFVDVVENMQDSMDGILQMSRRLLATGLNDQQLSYTRLMKIRAKTLLGTIGDVSEYARIDAGNVRLESNPVNLPWLVNDIVAGMTLSTKSKKLFLKHDIEDAIPGQLNGDADRIRQVLETLIAAAIRRTSGGGVDLKVAVAPNPATDTAVTAKLWVKLTVSDSGKHIPQDEQNRMFEKFSLEVDPRHSHVTLEITAMRELVALMNGKIGLESEPGKGSTFWVSLPFDSPSSPEIEKDADREANIDDVTFSETEAAVVADPVNEGIAAEADAIFAETTDAETAMMDSETPAGKTDEALFEFFENESAEKIAAVNAENNADELSESPETDITAAESQKPAGKTDEALFEFFENESAEKIAAVNAENNADELSESTDAETAKIDSEASAGKTDEALFEFFENESAETEDVETDGQVYDDITNHDDSDVIAHEALDSDKNNDDTLFEFFENESAETEDVETDGQVYDDINSDDDDDSDVIAHEALDSDKNNDDTLFEFFEIESAETEDVETDGQVYDDINSDDDDSDVIAHEALDSEEDNDEKRIEFIENHVTESDTGDIDNEVYDELTIISDMNSDIDETSAEELKEDVGGDPFEYFQNEPELLTDTAGHSELTAAADAENREQPPLEAAEDIIEETFSYAEDDLENDPEMDSDIAENIEAELTETDSEDISGEDKDVTVMDAVTESGTPEMDTAHMEDDLANDPELNSDIAENIEAELTETDSEDISGEDKDVTVVDAVTESGTPEMDTAHTEDDLANDPELNSDIAENIEAELIETDSEDISGEDKDVTVMDAVTESGTPEMDTAHTETEIIAVEDAFMETYSLEDALREIMAETEDMMTPLTEDGDFYEFEIDIPDEVLETLTVPPDAEAAENAPVDAPVDVAAADQIQADIDDTHTEITTVEDAELMDENGGDENQSDDVHLVLDDKPLDAAAEIPEMPIIDGIPDLTVNPEVVERASMSDAPLDTQQPASSDAPDSVPAEAIAADSLTSASEPDGNSDSADESQKTVLPMTFDAGRLFGSKQLRVLIADGNQSNQAYTRMLLEQINVDVQVTENSQLTIEAVAREKYDLILVDLQMLEQEGLHALQAIRACEALSGKHLPVIALTESSIDSIIDECREYGIDGHICKPISIARFQSELESVLKSPSAAE